MKRLLEEQEFKDSVEAGNEYFLFKIKYVDNNLQGKFMVVKDKDKQGVYFEVFDLADKIKFEEFFRYKGTWLKGTYELYLLTDEEGSEFIKNILADKISGDSSFGEMTFIIPKEEGSSKR